LYTDFEWFPWKFDKCPQNYWDDVKNQRKFMEWAANELKIKENSGWYSIAVKVHFYSKIPKFLGLGGIRRSSTAQ
jgi:hypothetical protein